MDMGLVLTIVGLLLTVIFGIVTVVAWFFPTWGTEIWQYLESFPKRKSMHIEDYFIAIKGDSKPLDYVIYQLGIRPKIPLVDLLYLEYLHYHINAGYIKQVLLVPSPDLSSRHQDESGVVEFKENLKKIFKGAIDKVELIEMSSIGTLEPFSIQFLEVVRFVGSEEFIKYVNRNFSKRIKGYCDFNKFHPRERRLLALHSHIVTAWTIMEYLRKKDIIKDKCSINIGFLIWETELDKLGVYRHYARPLGALSVTPMLGKSIMFRKEIFKKEPLPVFEEDGAVVAFNPIQNTIQKFCKGTHNGSFYGDEFRKYFEVLSCILMSNYGKDIPFKSACVKGEEIVRHFQVNKDLEIAVSQHFFAFLYLLKTLREIYDDQ